MGNFPENELFEHCDVFTVNSLIDTTAPRAILETGMLSSNLLGCVSQKTAFFT